MWTDKVTHNNFLVVWYFNTRLFKFLEVSAIINALHGCDFGLIVTIR